MTVANGDKGDVLFALVDTEGQQRLLAIGIKVSNAPHAVEQAGRAALLSIRRRPA
jgi:hypothetical protein